MRPSARATPEEYLAFERAAEGSHDYVDGVIGDERYSSLAHSRIKTDALVALSEALRETDAEVFSAFRLRIPGEPSYVYPDLVVVDGRAETEDEHDDSLLNPSIIVEVLWPSTEDYDRGRKWDLYRSVPSLNHFVLIDSSRMQVEWYSRFTEGRWIFGETASPDGVLEFDAPRCAVRLADLYGRMAELLHPSLSEA
jgi:Uma2 family endonuclease